jgi:hypothetical protein
LTQNGFGPDYVQLSKYFDDIVNELKKSITLGRKTDVLQSLENLFKECSDEGWDGYEASPITEDAYLEARKLIGNLPINLRMPEVVPEPSGEIGLEWSRGKDRVFVVSLSGKNEIAYAGLFGINKVHGVEYFGDAIPSTILENIRRLYA